jgi:hypothetical protein
MLLTSSSVSVRTGIEAPHTWFFAITAWTSDELTQIGLAVEFQVASRRSDSSLRPYVMIWGVRHAAHIYVRSAHGWNNPWFQRALQSGDGRIRAGGVERDIAFEQPDPDVGEDVHAAYHAKYDGYGPGIVGTVVSPEAARSTLRLVPR